MGDGGGGGEDGAPDSLPHRGRIISQSPGVQHCRSSLLLCSCCTLSLPDASRPCISSRRPGPSQSLGAVEGGHPSSFGQTHISPTINVVMHHPAQPPSHLATQPLSHPAIQPPSHPAMCNLGLPADAIPTIVFQCPDLCTQHRRAFLATSAARGWRGVQAGMGHSMAAWG